MPDVVSLSAHAMCHKVTFPMCAFNAPYQKYTTLLYTPGLAAGFDDFALLRCTHSDKEHRERAGGAKVDGVWNSKAAAAYPPDLNHAIAHAINLLVDRLSYVPRIEARRIAPTIGHQIAAAPPPRTAVPAPAPTTVPLPVPSSETRPEPELSRGPGLEPAPTSSLLEAERPAPPSSRTRAALRSSGHSPTVSGAMLADALLSGGPAAPLVMLAKATPLDSPTAPPRGPPPDPRTRLEAMRDDPDGWGRAELAELESHRRNGSFELMDRSEFETQAPARRLIKLVWVYKRKRSGKLKARLCVQGCRQQAGVDFDQTHCSTLRGPSLRMLAALAGHHRFGMHRWDFVSAYLQGELEDGEAVYCQAPPGPHGQLGADGRPRVWKVVKPVYGLAQAGRRWQRSLFPWLKEWGFEQCDSDPCVFKRTMEVDTPNGKRLDTVIVGCYVDDLFVLFNTNDKHSLYYRFAQDLQARWDVDDEGPVTDLLNIEIAREGPAIVLRQRQYIERLVDQWFPDGPPAHIPKNATPHADNLIRVDNWFKSELLF